MNDDTEVDGGEGSVPVRAEDREIMFCDQPNPLEGKSLRFIIRDILDKSAVSKAVAPFLVRNVRGHKVLNRGRMAEIVREYDNADGKRLEPFGLDDWQLTEKTWEVIRERLAADPKTGLIIGQSKRALLAQSKGKA